MMLHLRGLGLQKTPCDVPILQAILDKMDLRVPAKDKNRSSAIPYKSDGIVDFDALDQSEASSSYPLMEFNINVFKKVGKFQSSRVSMLASAIEMFRNWKAPHLERFRN